MLFAVVRAALPGLALFLFIRGVTYSGIIWFDTSYDAYSMALGCGLGLFAANLGPYLGSFVWMRGSRWLSPVQVLDDERVGCLLNARRAGYLSQIPMDFMNQKVVLCAWNSSGNYRPIRFRLAVWFLSDAVGLMMFGCLFSIIGWMIRYESTFGSSFALMLGWVTIFHSCVALFVPKTANQLSLIRQSLDIASAGSRFDSQVRRALAVQFELLSGWRPGELSPDVDALFDLLVTANECPATDSLDRFAGLRGRYLTALGRRDWRTANVISNQVQILAMNGSLPSHARDCAFLHVAFHRAFVNADVIASRNALGKIDNHEYFANTPLSLLVNGLNSIMTGDFVSAGRFIAKAQRTTCGLVWMSGTALLWFAIIDGIVATIPEPYRPSFRYSLSNPDGGVAATEY